MGSEGRLVEIQPGSEGRSWLSPEPPAADCGTSGFWPEHCFLLGEGFRRRAMRWPVELPWPMHSLQADPEGQRGPRPAGPRKPQPAGRPRPPWRRWFARAWGCDSSKCAAWDAPLSFREGEVNRRIFRLGVFLPGESFRLGLWGFPPKPGASLGSECRFVEIQPGPEDRSWLSPEPPAADRGTSGFWPEHCFLWPAPGNFHHRRALTPPVLPRVSRLPCHRHSS